jgi:hypothetical protein
VRDGRRVTVMRCTVYVWEIEMFVVDPCPCVSIRALHVDITLRLRADAQQEQRACNGEEVHKGQIAPVDGVPAPVLPVDLGADRSHGVQVAHVSEQQDSEEDSPDFEVGCGA